MSLVDSLAVAADYAHQRAIGPACFGQFAAARAWLLLPAMWAARAGVLAADWRAALPVLDSTAPIDTRAAVIDAAEMSVQAWEPGRGGDPLAALDGWYSAASGEAAALCAVAAQDYQDGLVSLEVLRACHAMCVLTDASFLAAGGQFLPSGKAALRDNTPLDMPEPDYLSDADEARVYGDSPWKEPSARGLDSRIQAAVLAVDAETLRFAARTRLSRW